MNRLFLLLALLLAGCNTVDNLIHKNEGSGRPIEVFRDGQVPGQPYQQVGLLTDDGALSEQGAIERKFISQARRMGGDAILLEPLTKTGTELQGLGVVDTFLFKASVVVLTPATPPADN